MRVERDGDVAIVRMEAGRANAMNLDFLERLGALVDEAASAKAVVLVGQDKFFAAGLDLPSILDLDRAPLRGFMGRFDEALLKVFELPVPVVAAINGHAVAGGYVLALQADLRIAVDRDGVRIGLNEAQLGLGLPPIVTEPLRAQVPASSLPRVALAGELFNPREALSLGLVHDLACEGELLAKAVSRAKALAALPGAGIAHVKAGLRRPVAALVRANADAEAERWLDTWFAAPTQAILRAAVAKLKSKG
ncbi:MAG TPA: enoyl-CoA hydratase/isomerase family protein [Myxococcales bacterium]|jgi:enoyl-CoA hydratase